MIAALLDSQKAASRAHPYPSAVERRDHLDRLLKAMLARKEDFARAIHVDFGGRSRTEILYSEVYVSANSIRYARRHLREWMRSRKRPVAWPLQPGRAYVLPQPVGVVGIISPWNYPLFLTIGPLAGALAAGNRAIVKPSELTPVTSALIASMIAETFQRDHVAVVTGDADVGREFSTLPFDHLLFTGSTEVGRVVMRAASENLTPVTLELGGKSPALIAPDADIQRAAADIVYGKLMNAGQTCIAPDYVLAPESQLEALVTALTAAIERYYPNATANPDYTSIINEKHAARLQGYLDEARGRGVRIVGAALHDRRLAPTLLIDPPADLAVMRDEIFGPLLPIKTYGKIGEAVEYINARPRPLALYIFARSNRTIESVLTSTVSGGVSVNDTLVHIVADNLPFGGIGASGTGHYHGREGFDTFSKLKPVFQRRWPGLGASLRPPYRKLHEWMARFLIGG